MPSLDVSDAFDPSFFDTFDLHRRVETVTNHGRSSVVTTITPDQLGVVEASSPNDLERWPEADVSLKSINIITKVRLQLASTPGPADGETYKADVVYWAGNYYQVGYVDDYSRYGEGYIFAIAQTTAYVPAAPTPAVA